MGQVSLSVALHDSLPVSMSGQDSRVSDSLCKLLLIKASVSQELFSNSKYQCQINTRVVCGLAGRPRGSILQPHPVVPSFAQIRLISTRCLSKRQYLQACSHQIFSGISQDSRSVQLCLLILPPRWHILAAWETATLTSMPHKQYWADGSHYSSVMPPHDKKKKRSHTRLVQNLWRGDYD